MDLSTKLIRRAAWTVRSKLSPPPRVDTLHEDGAEWVVTCHDPAYIEPEHGFVVTEGGYLIEDSLISNYDWWQIGGRWTNPRASWRTGLPAAVPSRSATVEHHPMVVSLRHRWEYNYYHFFIDVLGKLQLLDQYVDPATPVVLGRYANHQPFTEILMKLPNRNWIIPDVDDRLVVHADRITYCRTRQPYRARVDALLDEMGFNSARRNDRIFLTRRPPVSRCLTNEDELQPVLDHYGFRTVDAAALSLDEQISTFVDARYVVAVHGAGITNIIFRNGVPLDLIELHSHEYPGTGEFERLCREFGYGHHALAGGERGTPIHAHFSIDPQQLDVLLNSVVERRLVPSRQLPDWRQAA